MESPGSNEDAVCCLCGNTVGLRSAVVVVLYANIDSQDSSQNLYSHGRCFKNHLAVDAPLISELNSDAASSYQSLAPGIMESLAHYVGVLVESVNTTHRSEDRLRYERHLAQAARMFYAIRTDPTLGKLSALVAEERHSFGWSFLSGDEGARVSSTRSPHWWTTH